MKKKLLALAMIAMIAFPTTVLAAVDNEDPGDVETLTATAMDGAVKLVWSKATDNVAVTGYTVHYGTSAVTKSGQDYDKAVDAGNKLEYVVSGLENDTKYYFSVTAYDAAENESAAWSPEANATPNSDGEKNNDKDSPQVKEAEAQYITSVKVVFSEAVVLPEDSPEDAFTIENDDTFEGLDVFDAMLDEDDDSGKTVILETAEQEVDASYKLTVGVDIEDLAGNPIISGTSDTALFDGSDEEAPSTDGPQITGIEVVDPEHVLITFDETIVLSIDPAENFEFVAKSDSEDKLEVLKVELGDNNDGTEDAAALVKTTAQSGATYMVTVTGVTDEDGNEIVDGEIEFEGMGEGGQGGDDDEVDTQAPKDVAKLIATKVLKAEKYLVTLKWEIPSENVGDVVEQIVYLSKNLGESYSKEASLEPDVTEYEAGEFEPGDYWFKVTQVDEAGNESEGVITKLTLSETGPELLGLLAFSLGMGQIAGRRKKKK